MKFGITLFSNLISATKKRQRLRSRQPKEIVSDASIATDASIPSPSLQTAIEPDVEEWYPESIEIFPKSLIINTTLNGTLHIRNTHSFEWLAVHVLLYSLCIKAFPQKFLIPPARTAATDISIVCVPTHPRQYNLVVQWFSIGSDCPPCNSELIWKKPHRRISRKRWSQRAVWVYFHPGIVSSCEISTPIGFIDCEEIQ